MKILIVDDNKENLNLLKDFIESWGYESFLAQNGFEAFEIAKFEMPDIILLDVMLPGISGYELCHRIRIDADLRNVPVILLTALSEEENRIQGYLVGADAFLSKPINYKELKVIIEHFLIRTSFLYKTESRVIVARFIEELVLNEASEKEVNILKEKYCRKLIDSLQLNDDIAERVEVASRLFSKKIFENNARIIDKLLKFKMGKWLVPLLYYLHEYKDASSKKESNLFGIEAEILVVIIEFCKLKNKGFINEQIVDFLKSNREKMGYNKLVIEKLEESINAEELLNSLKD